MKVEEQKEVYAASELTLKTKKRHINPRTETQGVFIDAMNKARAMQCDREPIIERQTYKQFIKGLGLKSHKVFD